AVEFSHENTPLVRKESLKRKKLDEPIGAQLRSHPVTQSQDYPAEGNDGGQGAEPGLQVRSHRAGQQQQEDHWHVDPEHAANRETKNQESTHENHPSNKDWTGTGGGSRTAEKSAISKPFTCRCPTPWSPSATVPTSTYT